MLRLRGSQAHSKFRIQKILNSLQEQYPMPSFSIWLNCMTNSPRWTRLSWKS